MKTIKVLICILLALTISDLSAQNNKKSKNNFTIERGDVLSIMVMDHPEFTIKDIKVLPDGYIQFPVLGNIMAANMTTKALSDSLANSLKRYVVEPIVTVIINKLENSTINVFGYFNKPGKYLIYKPTDALTAFSMAGGIKNIRKARKITIIRKNGAIETYKLRSKLRNKMYTLRRIRPLMPGDSVVLKDPIKIEWSLISALVAAANLIVVLVK